MCASEKTPNEIQSLFLVIYNSQSLSGPQLSVLSVPTGKGGEHLFQGILLSAASELSLHCYHGNIPALRDKSKHTFPGGLLP